MKTYKLGRFKVDVDLAYQKHIAVALIAFKPVYGGVEFRAMLPMLYFAIRFYTEKVVF